MLSKRREIDDTHRQEKDLGMPPSDESGMLEETLKSGGLSTSGGRLYSIPINNSPTSIHSQRRGSLLFPIKEDSEEEPRQKERDALYAKGCEIIAQPDIFTLAEAETVLNELFYLPMYSEHGGKEDPVALVGNLPFSQDLQARLADKLKEIIGDKRSSQPGYK